jgi:hypothetical protein
LASVLFGRNFGGGTAAAAAAAPSLIMQLIKVCPSCRFIYNIVSRFFSAKSPSEILTLPLIAAAASHVSELVPGPSFSGTAAGWCCIHVVKCDTFMFRVENRFPGEGQRATEAALQMEGSGREDGV